MVLRRTINLYKEAQRLAKANREKEQVPMQALEQQSTRKVMATLKEQRKATLKPPTQAVVFVRKERA